LENSKNLLLKEKNLLEEFLSLAPLFKEVCSAKKEVHPEFLKQIEVLIQCLTQESSIQETFDILLSYGESVFHYLVEARLKKQVKVPFETLKKQSVIFSIKEAVESIISEASNPLNTLLKVGSLCKRRLEKMFGQDDLLAPDDLLKIMKRSLNKGPFLKKVQSRYKAAIIDEFQDTDPLQWDIFYHLFVKDREAFPLFLVGDPKQSIYGFRNADLPTYLQAWKTLPVEQRFSLDTNYRSEPALLKALNGLFSASSSWLSEEEALIYREVKANPHATNTAFEDGFGPLHILSIEEEEKEKNTPSKHTEENYLFPCIAKEILKLRQKHGDALGSIAILIRDRFQAQRVQAYLKRKNIPCQGVSSTYLVDTIAFNFLKTLLKVMAHLEDLSLIKQLLAHPMMGFSHRDLRRDQKNGRLIHAITQLKNLSQIYFEKGFLLFWSAFLQTSFYEEEITFEQRLVSQEEIQHYQDLDQLIQLLVERHTQAYLSHEELLYLLEHFKESGSEENANMKRKILPEEQAVTIMTIHKSKGLEFDIVFALGVCASVTYQEEVIKCQGRIEIFDEQDVDHQGALKAIDQEKLRQLYVALTRAKKRVYVPLCFQNEKNGKLKGSLSPIALFLTRLGIQEVFSKEEVLEKLQSLNIPDLTISDLNIEFRKEITHCLSRREKKKPDLVKPVMYRKKYEARYAGSYSSLVHQREFRESEERISETPLLPASADMGILMHAVLEKLFDRGGYRLFNEAMIRALIVEETRLSHLKGFEEEIFQVIEKTLYLFFRDGDKVFSFKDISPSHLCTEMKFLLEESTSEYFKGFIDVVFSYDNRYYLVDWKSNFLGLSQEDYGEENLKRVIEREGYLIQASLYGKAFKSYLQRMGKEETSYGGIFYVFLRGLEKETSQGIFHIL
jgi:exodeoxyribonuclease V beta subunit